MAKDAQETMQQAEEQVDDVTIEKETEDVKDPADTPDETIQQEEEESPLDRIIRKRTKGPTIVREEVIGEDGQSVEFSVKVGVKEMFDFLMYYNYHSFSGVLGMLISVCSGVALLMFHNSLDSLTNFILVILFLIYIVINPILIWNRASKQIRSSDVFKYSMDYILGSKGFNVTQRGQELFRVPWDKVFRVKDTGKCLIIYLSRVNVYILPKEQLASKKADVLQMIRANTKKGTVKVRR
ncbi:MAG TPA: YcxB family protein [Candidatus Onthocola gallistercoris]|uniref:YcxB family protein n=1 Tax=Candidatus Onthocola gallistercoris TaxID=2840876 RepID=A0A9D1HHY8_9FIRM|nr:YcxB family protein [Candidatus Onthocola gallistercoris]